MRSLIPRRILPAVEQKITERRQPARHGFASRPHDADLGGRGPFGGEAKQAMQQHVDFLAGRGLAEQRGPCVILARNLMGTLRSRELMRAADTGLEHRLLAEGSTWRASYREGSSTIARSCWQRTRYAILDDSTGLSLVP